MKLSFWFLVSAIFLLYGVIIFATGVYYWVAGANVPNGSYHVSVWWGLLLCIVSGVFWLVNRASSR